jgi:hypothetical protein
MNVDTGELEISDIEKNFIPGFFADEWKAQHNSDFLDVYRKEENTEINGNWLGIIGCIALPVGIGVPMILFHIFHLPWITVAGAILAIGGAVMYLVGINKPQADDGAAHLYFEKIERLFIVFEIEPNEDIGKLSREQFRAAVEDSLQIQAGKSDKAGGFNRVKEKTLFCDMHAVALEWKLCHESYVGYFQ